MDLIVRNARLSHDPEAPPMDIGVQAGRIVAVGKHAELMRSSPLYAKLAALQFNAAEEALEV